MTPEAWTNWPAREALSRAGRTDARRWLNRGVRVLALGVLLWSTFSERHVAGWGAVAAVAGVLLTGFLAWCFYRTTLRNDLWPSVGLLVLLMGGAVIARHGGFEIPATVLWCGCAVVAMERLPLVAALPTTLVALGGFAAYNQDSWLTTTITTAGLLLAGYVLRLDAEARGNAQRLLAQERAARAAEAESAALAERARIARDIHDVLAHSLSAQLVHLEAARLRIEREPHSPFRDQILERVVAARSMAREGLAETRQALSALRGEMAPLGDYLRELAAMDGAEVEIGGEPRPLPAEASQTVRRVVQEALTNVRKHAPGARVLIRLTYGADEVTLDVRDSGGKGPAPAGLGASGSGYGLLGMKERAELLGGTLEAGPGGPEDPDEKGFSVRLRVPA
ncbi:histidine kinase [Streptomyces scopuliridis]|uniref:Histidine kinase n=1 Tax=Streptomyces scopuliridis TaxID=452529 RepID=A0ACD4ZGE7_9ACTN|nr:histidine kinase [Streptomyces scopuliridis]WSB32992.1 histidine kinase [Streptomyces scopuliridis]WSB97249.1 histidine kinase [Streptomyces scopuliridis]WSC09047.1 histidine kinase [Streptomyces scopuliridis]